MISYCHVNRFFGPYRGGLSSALPWLGEGQALALQGQRRILLHRSAGACPPRCRGVAMDRPSSYRAGDSSHFTVARGPVPRIYCTTRDRSSLVRDQAIPNYSLWGHCTTRDRPSSKPVGAV